MQGHTNFSACYNRAGFGYSRGIVTPCAPGTYVAERAMTQCTACPIHRVTLSEAQAAITDCVVAPGYGLAYANGILMTSIHAAALSPAQAASANVVLCPNTHYSAGHAVNSACILCPSGTSAVEPGATSAAECRAGKLLDVCGQRW
jgi:hypothetical protein